MNPKTALLFLLFAGVPASVAKPFSVRVLPAGMDAPDLGGRRAMFPVAADFLKNGRLQWYQGGKVISRFPENGTLTLPDITLPQTPSATVLGLAGAVCDVDRDGDQDLVRINQWNGNAFEYTLQVFLNNGAGTFSLGYRVDWTNSLPWNEGNHYLSIAPADYNGDGAPDLAILETYAAIRTDSDPNYFGGKLYIRWNDGTGGFAAATTLQPSSLEGDCRISTADYDRDGDPDILCSRYTLCGPDTFFGACEWEVHRSLLFANDGSGAFAHGDNFPSYMPDRLVDLNGDGWADLADSVNKAMNNGDGTFGAPGRTSGTNGAVVSTFADITDDGLPELIYAEGAKLLWQYPDGSQPGTQGFAIVTLPATPDGIGAADSDGDGDTDLLVSMTDGTFAFVENQEFHTVPGAALRATMTLTGITGLHSADFNRDGYDDVLAVTPAEKKWWIIPGQSNGIPGTPLFRITHGEAAHSAAVADFDRDGLPDVAYTVPSTGYVFLASNNGSINPLAWPETIVASGLAGVAQLVSGEYGTPDGLPDLFSANGVTGQVRGFYRTGSSWNGQNIFGAVSPVPGSIAAAEVNAAPGSELAMLASDSSGLTMRAARLSGGWVQHGNLHTEVVNGGPHTPKLVWADGTGDRYKEVIYIDGNGELAVWSPVGNLSSTIGASPSPIRDFTPVDWDGDGRTDFLCATDTGLSLFHYERGRNRWLLTELYRPTVGGYTSVATLRIHRDGRPDAVAASSVTGNLQYLLNDSHSVRADLGAVPASVTVTRGKTASLLTLPLRTAARPADSTGTGDPPAAVNRCEVQFQEAVAGPGGAWIPGIPLGQNIVSAYLLSAGLFANGNSVVSKDPSAILADGSLFLDNNIPGSVPAPIPPGNTLEHTLLCGIAPANSIQTNNPRFFVTVKSMYAAPTYDGSPNTPGMGDTALLETNHPVLVTIVPDYSPLEAWRNSHFNTPVSEGYAANDADFEGDGVLNLVEYVLGTSPVTDESATNTLRSLALVTPAGPQSPVNLRLILSNQAMADAKVRVTIQQGTLAGGWTTYATRIGGGSWTGATPQTLPSNGGTTTTHLFTTGLTPAGTPRQYFRLKVEELP